LNGKRPKLRTLSNPAYGKRNNGKNKAGGRP